MLWQRRIDYERAMYHVLSHEDRGEAIFLARPIIMISSRLWRVLAKARFCRPFLLLDEKQHS